MFLEELERIVLEGQILHALDLGLCANPSQWWETHKENMGNQDECTQMMTLRFEHQTIRMEEVYS